MRHEQTVMIMLYFQRSRSKVGKAINAIKAIMDSKTISSKGKLDLFLPLLVATGMNQSFFVKNKKTNKFDLVKYDSIHFDILKWNEYDIEFRTHIDRPYIHGSVLFTLKRKNVFIVK